MFYPKIHEQTILEISQGDSIRAAADSFLIDRQARDLSRHTLRFYKGFLNTFIEYCGVNSLTLIQEITPDFLRRYFLAFGEKHNPGGVHAAYRTLRAFFQWLMKEEVMAPDWKNPMLKVKAPKVVLDPLEPISIQDVRALINTCQRGDFIGERDRAIFLFLLDTGARAREACNMNIKDVALNSGAVMIRYGKGGKTRMVFIGRTTRRAMRAYLRQRHDSCPALFVSKDEERLTYDGLRQLLERRAKRARLSNKPELHGFRRAFALNMLRSGVDIFVLQRLMGYSDLQVLRRYLAQNDEDNQLAHMRGSPVDNNF
ncbi:MAG TPA: tyrosine-type recombinase/integrase [Anaerolineales bacterium]|nr:tyrosine-type recombinase/integrase [Anaerolineales bacterium]